MFLKLSCKNYNTYNTFHTSIVRIVSIVQSYNTCHTSIVSIVGIVQYLQYFHMYCKVLYNTLQYFWSVWPLKFVTFKNKEIIKNNIAYLAYNFFVTRPSYNDFAFIKLSDINFCLTVFNAFENFKLRFFIAALLQIQIFIWNVINYELNV